MMDPAGDDVTSAGGEKRFGGWVHDPSEWALHTRMLSREQRSILADVYGDVWVSGPTQDTLDVEIVLPRQIGAEWREHLAWLRLYFVPVPETEGMLRAPYLTGKLTIARAARTRFSNAGAKSAEARRARAHAKKRGRKPRDGNDLYVVEQRTNDVEQRTNVVEQIGSELSSRENPSRILSREESGADVAAAGRGVPTAAPPSPRTAAQDGATGARPPTSGPPAPPTSAAPSRRHGGPVSIGAVAAPARPPAPPAPAAPLSRSAAAALAGGQRSARPVLVAADSAATEGPTRGEMERWVLQHAADELEERIALAREAQPEALPQPLRALAISQVYGRHHAPAGRHPALAP